MASAKRPFLGETTPQSHPAGEVCARPERLVGLGFRRGLAALETRDIANWQFAWQEFANVAGPDHATVLVAELSLWCRTVRKCAARRIETYPLGCPGFCRDECLAISMIAASQRSICPALRACAFALLGSSEQDEPLQAAARFGKGLAEVGQVLSLTSVCDALAAMPAASHRPS